MNYFQVLFISIFLILNHLIILSSSQQSPVFNFCRPYNFTANSIYSSNLKDLLSNSSSLISNDYGYYNISVGLDSDQVNGVALCRGDIKPQACLTCIETAALQLPGACPTAKEAVIWYDACMVRYSNKTLVGKWEDSMFFLGPGTDATDVENFNKAVRDLLNKLRARAVVGGTQKKYATENITGPASQPIYGLLQCTPDLTEKDCNQCLVNAIYQLPNCCDGKTGGGTVGPSCNFRYDNYQFYDPQADPGGALPPAPAPSAPKSPPAPAPVSNSPPPPPSCWRKI